MKKVALIHLRIYLRTPKKLLSSKSFCLLKYRLPDFVLFWCSTLLTCTGNGVNRLFFVNLSSCRFSCEKAHVSPSQGRPEGRLLPHPGYNRIVAAAALIKYDKYLHLANELSGRASSPLSRDFHSQQQPTLCNVTTIFQQRRTHTINYHAHMTWPGDGSKFGCRDNDLRVWRNQGYWFQFYAGEDCSANRDTQ